MNRQSRRPRPGGGFTIIELIAVLVVVAILSGVAVATLSSAADTRLAAAARRVHRDVTYARQRAVATGTRTWVVFDPATESYQVLGEDPANPGRANATVLVDLGSGADFNVLLADAFIGADIVAADFDGDVELGFDWLGRPLSSAETSLAAAGSITLGGGWTMTVEATTGHIALIEP